MSKIILGIGIICAIVTGFLVFQKVAEAEDRMRSIAYLSFATDARDPVLFAGESVSSAVLGRIELPNGNDVFGLGAQLIEDTSLNRAWIEGKELNTTIPRGRVLTYDLFEPLDVDRLDQIVVPGNRATALTVSEATSLDNRILPGNRIDVFGVLRSDEGLVTQVVLEDVRVMGVGTAISYEDYRAGQDRYSTITIEVTPEQGLRLAGAREALKGEFTILLRNQCDTATPSEICG